MSVVATIVVGADGSTSKVSTPKGSTARGSTTMDSTSDGVTSKEDRRIFLERRKMVDCIIIGGNTARHEPYQKTPVPLVILSRSIENPVPSNPLAQVWSCTPTEAVARAKEKFGAKILIEAGASIILELVDNNQIDQLELSVTRATNGQNKIDIKKLLANFSKLEKREEGETIFYSAHN